MSDFNKNLWAPWRMEYISQLCEPEGGCFLCAARANPQDDEKNFVLKRGRHSFIILNRFPYSNGHMLIAPNQHLGDLDTINDETMLEMTHFLREMKHLLTNTIRAQGFNVGINLGHCAGAGLPEHLHIHIVPRWAGDTNFMSVIDPNGIRVIPEALDRTYKKLRQGLAEL
jgi:ATP adenylyltransferase